MRAKKMLCSSPEEREHPGVVDVCGQKGPQKSAGPQKFVVFTQCLQSQETECSVLGMLLSSSPTCHVLLETPGALQTGQGLPESLEYSSSHVVQRL